MKRREFLLSTSGRRRVLDLSCETLFTEYLDAMIDETTDEFLDGVRRQLEGAHTIRLRKAFWLRRKDLHGSLTPLLDGFRTRGGKVEYL